MEDARIVELYWERDEAAIAESSAKYGGYCYQIAFRILALREDAEECVGDTWLRAWEAMPPSRPGRLDTFLGKITRNLSLDRWRALRAQKRWQGQAELALTELGDCLPASGGVEQEVEAAGLHISGIESVNVHDAIKTGAADREVYVGRYIETLENLGQEDIHLVCYNFMPVFDWTRTELARLRPDGSTVLAYTQEAVDRLDPETMFSSIAGDMNGTVLPGWEPERMARVKELFAMYQGVDEERLFENLRYFLEQIMPVCRKYDIRMAIHPDDPAWSVFGLPRIMTNKENVLRIMDMVDDPHNGVAFCTGSFGTSRANDLPDMIRALKGRIHFAHVRNLKFNSPTDFEEAAHLSSGGSFDMYQIMKALYDTGFSGPIRPDHGRMIWGEEAMPGYGLYDRALGAAYLNGLWEAIEKGEKVNGAQ